MSENTIEVQPVADDHAGAVSEVLAVVQDEPAVEADQLADVLPSGRTFAVGAEPVDAGVVYRSVDGTAFYRPVWRVADRAPGLVAGPDVWFGRDADGAIGLRWTLADVPPPDAPADAWSLAVGIEAVTMVWNGGSREFDAPVLQPLFEVLPGSPSFLVHGAVQLVPDEARTLELAMSDAASGCRLEVTTTVHYVVGAPDQPGTRPMILLIEQNHIADEFKAYGYEIRPLDFEGQMWWVVEVDRDPDMAENLLEERGLSWPTHEDLARFERYVRDMYGTARYDELAGSPTRREFHEPVTQQVPFVFNPNDDAYRPIYRALHGAANLTDTWQKSSAGWLRASPFPNTIYRVPDEVRLAFDADLGTPHVVTTLYADEQSRSMVRVLLRVAPWQDPRKIVEARTLTGSEGAKVIVGAVRDATLRLGGSFPEGIRVSGGADGGAFSLTDGADLLMDLSLEYFQLLCDLLGGAVGLPGQVDVRLDEQTTATVPVSLRMDKVHDLPVGVEVLASGAGSPTAVQVTNRSGTAIRVGGCAAALLRLDSGSVLPMATYPTRCTTVFPLELAPDGTADLTFEAAEPAEGQRWNAVLVELLDKTMVDDARAILLRAQQLAGSGELTWDLVVSTPVFAAPAPPQRWAHLASLEAEVSAPGFETVSVVLRKESPTRTLTMRKPLSALVAGEAAGIRTVTYRVRNNYLDHQGEWTQPQQQSGEELVVFPNPAEGR